MFLWPQVLSGNRLILYSDGVTEAQDADGEMFGFERLRALVGEMTELSLEGVIENVMTTIQEHEGGQLSQDDTTLWALEVK